MADQAVHERGSLARISDALPKLHGAIEKVARFILQSPKETIDMTVTELGVRVGVSDATVVRFAQSLGYSGFHALKIRLAEDIVSPMAIVHEDWTPDDKPSTVVQKAMAAGLRSLEDTARILDMPALETAIDAICTARQIVLFASGNTGPVAMDFNFRLTSIGFHSRFSTDATLQEMHAVFTSPEDVAIGMSHTGSSKDTVHALELAKEHGATTICVTNHSDSPLTRFGDICLFTASRVSHMYEMRMDSNLAMLALTEALVTGICANRADAADQAVFQTLRATEHRKY